MADNNTINIEQLVQELTNQAVVVQQLRTRVQELSAVPGPVATPAPALDTLKFPDPGKFDGMKHHSYAQWKKKVEAKRRTDRVRLGDETQQAWYVFSMLESPASDRIEPWISAQTNPTADTLLAHLDCYYLNPSHQERALQKLYASKQGGQSLTLFQQSSTNGFWKQEVQDGRIPTR